MHALSLLQRLVVKQPHHFRVGITCRKKKEKPMNGGTLATLKIVRRDVLSNHKIKSLTAKCSLTHRLLFVFFNCNLDLDTLGL